MKGQVYFKDTGVYLYTHHDAEDLKENVIKAIQRRKRWDDPEYLARMVLENMIENDFGSPTGFGIGTKQAGDISVLVTVSCRDGLVEVLEEKGKTAYTFPQLIKPDLM